MLCKRSPPHNHGITQGNGGTACRKESGSLGTGNQCSVGAVAGKGFWKKLDLEGQTADSEDTGAHEGRRGYLHRGNQASKAEPKGAGRLDRQFCSVCRQIMAPGWAAAGVRAKSLALGGVMAGGQAGPDGEAETADAHSYSFAITEGPETLSLEGDSMPRSHGLCPPSPRHKPSLCESVFSLRYSAPTLGPRPLPIQSTGAATMG